VINPSVAQRELASGFLGRVSFEAGERRQRQARDAVRAGGRESLLLLEHDHVVTLGRNASVDDLVASPAWLAAHGVAVAHCDRGGQVTYHGPGQLVGYPILDLNPDRRDVRRYVRDLEEVLIASLAEFGVGARRRAATEPVGVWVGEEKIASIGIHLSRWLTTHGFALNVSTDLSYFAAIVPCGLRQVRMTSLERLTGAAPALDEVAAVVARRLAERFERQLVALPEVPLPADLAAAAAGCDAPGCRV
jgi:lipoyl(octanoyl) transferase